MAEALTRSQIADAYKARLTILAREYDLQSLGDLQIEGYMLIPDSEDQTVYLVLNNNALTLRREQYHHDLSELAAAAIKETGEFSSEYGWITTEINDRSIIHPVSIAKLLPIKDKASAHILTDTIRKKFEQATVTHGMLTVLESNSLGLEERDASNLERYGFASMIRTEQGKPMVLVATDGRMLLISGIIFGTNPAVVLQDYIGALYPGQSVRPNENEREHKQFPFRYSKDDSTAYHIGEYSNPHSIIIADKFWIEADTAYPISELKAFRAYISGLMMRGASASEAFNATDESKEAKKMLDELSLFELQRIFDQVVRIPADRRVEATRSLLLSKKYG